MKVGGALQAPIYIKKRPPESRGFIVDALLTMTVWSSYSVDIYPEGFPLPEYQVMCIYSKIQKNKNARRHKDFGHVRTRILCLLAQNSDTVALILYHCNQG
jgi:hypothetical protein